MDICGVLSYYSSWASLIGIPLTIIGLLLTKTVKDTIIESRFEKRLSTLMTKMREAQQKGSPTMLVAEIKILIHAFETSFNWFQLNFSTRIKKAYKEAKDQAASTNPDIKVLEGLLTNFKVLHDGVKP